MVVEAHDFGYGRGALAVGMYGVAPLGHTHPRRGVAPPTIAHGGETTTAGSDGRNCSDGQGCRRWHGLRSDTMKVA